MAWSTANTRNIYMTEATTLTRGLEFLSFMDHHLCEGSAGWTRVGSGGGTGGATGWGPAKVLPVYPSIVGMDANAWSVWRNASGAEFCLQIVTSGYGPSWWSPVAGFVVTGTSTTVPPSTSGSPPVDMVTCTSGSAVSIGTANKYFSMAYTDDHESFIVFGRRSSVTELGFCFLKLEDTKPGDLQPYWSYTASATGTHRWGVSQFNSGTGDIRGYHPLVGQRHDYYIPELHAANLFIQDNIPVDPVSGNIQIFDCLCFCINAVSKHVRGKIPGIKRVSSLSTGDRINHLGAGVYEYVVIGDYCVPWHSSDAMVW